MSTYAARLDIEVPTRAGDLPATLTVPPSPQGLVIFAVTQGARSLPAHRALAETLRGDDLATLRFDLVPDDLELLPDGVDLVDLRLLVDQLQAVTRWAADLYPSLPIGYLAVGAAVPAALRAAGTEPSRVRAVVCRGGLPDLAGDALLRVEAATLLLVSAAEPASLASHCEAERRLRGLRHLRLLTTAADAPPAGEAARAAADWLVRHLPRALGLGEELVLAQTGRLHSS